MLIKNKKLDFKKFKFITVVSSFFKKFIFFLGIIAFFLTALLSSYYFISGFSKSYPPKEFILRVNDKVIDKYIGFNIRNFFDYSKIFYLNLIGKITPSKLENVYLEMSQESILGIEAQRKIKSENGGELPDDYKIFLPGKININNQVYDIKLRTKGVRGLHWNERNSTSYKIDMIGNSRLWGMEEFSLQKPITRNYTYEYLFHKLLGHIELINIKYFFVNLYLNKQDLGVFAVEESFSKELVERNKKRNGPIFSLKDELSEYFPNVKFELYSENYWISQNKELTQNAFSILNNLKSQNFEINNHFDIDKWAKYFAIMDLTAAYHGSLLKSVKLFYNPVTALFEPIGYDLHKGAGIYGDFLLIDFLKKDTSQNINACSFICLHEEWYLKFFKSSNGDINYDFVKKYIHYLLQYSSNEFIENFISIVNNELTNYNNAIYKDNSKTDRVRWKGLGFFIYDKEYLFKRAKFIRDRINSSKLDFIEISINKSNFIYRDFESLKFPVIANTIECNSPQEKQFFFLYGSQSTNLKTSCKKLEISTFNNISKKFELNDNIKINPSDNVFNKKNFKNLKENQNINMISSKEYNATKDIVINEDTIVLIDEKFNLGKNISINIKNNSTLYVEGIINFDNDQDNLTKIHSEDMTGSVIFLNNDYNFKNLIFENLSKPNFTSHILYGGVNFINSNVKLNNVYLKNSRNEDGINIINSKSELKNIFFENIIADALDIDFGELNFLNLNCLNIRNDCLDISGAKVKGKNIITENIYDKGISVGENSIIQIKNLKMTNNNVALAVKDGSEAIIDNLDLINNALDIALFNKKKEYSKPSLTINTVKNIDRKKILQSKKTSLMINKEVFVGTYNDNFINSKIY